MAEVDNTLPPHFPRKPRPVTNILKTFPSDLLADGRDYYIQLQFIPYDLDFVKAAWSGWGSANPTGGIVLPLPMKINEVQTLVWQPTEVASQAANIATNLLSRNMWTAQQIAGMASQAAGAISPLVGWSINPMLWMTFRTPDFKQFTLNWIFAANNEQESEILSDIIHYIKKQILPAKAFGGLAYAYPDVALIRMYPKNEFTFAFKPCVVLGAAVDYTGGGSPSFYKNGAPTIVNLTIQLTEIDLWTKDNYWS
jgi:hypothetical protein